MHRRAFLTTLAALAWAPALVRAAARGQYRLLTYPGTGKADIRTAEFVAGLKPLQREVEQGTGARLSVSMVRGLKQYNAAAADLNKAPDLAYGPATSATVYIDAGFVPLVRVGKPASGMVVSRRPLAEVRSVAAPEPESWLAQVGEYSAEELAGRNLKFHYARTQDAAVEAMKYGMADAVVVRAPVFRKLREADPAYRVIVKLQETPDFTCLAHPDRLDEAARDRLRTTLLGLAPDTLRALDQVYHVRVEQFTRVQEDDYDVLRRIASLNRRRNG